MRRPRRQSRSAPPQRATTPRLEVLEERRLLSATPHDPIAEPLVLSGGAEFQVNTITMGDQATPNVTVFADGSYAILWRDPSFKFQRYDAAGNALGGETAISSVGNDLAIAADGTSVVVRIGAGIQARRHDASGNPMGSWFDVSSSAVGTMQFPRVFTAADGTHSFVWLGSNTDPEMLYVRRFSAAGVPLTAPMAIGRYSGVDIYVSMNPQGTLLIGRDSQVTQVKAGTNEVLHTNLPADALVKSVHVSTSGSFAVQYDTSGANYFVQRYDATGLADGSAVDVSASLAAGWKVALAPSGDFILTANSSQGGLEPPGSGTAIVAQRFTAEGIAKEPAFLVNSTVAGSQRYPRIALLNDANFVVTWQSPQDGSGNGIYAKRFSDDAVARVGIVAPLDGPSFGSGETLLSQVPGLRVAFSRPMHESTVETLANWQLLDDGVDVSSLVAGVTYENDVAYVTFSAPLRGTGYELIVQDAIQDTFGRALDGDGNAAAGGDYAISFSVRQGVFGIGPERIVHGEIHTPSGSPIVAIQDDGGFAVGYDTGGWIPTPALTEVRVFDSEGQTSSPIVSFESYSHSSGLMPIGNGAYLAHINGGVRQFAANGAGVATQFVGGGFHSAMPQTAARQSDGSFIVAKTVTAAGGDFDVYFQRFGADGLPLGAAVPLQPPGNGQKQGDPEILILENDDFVVAWVSSPLSGPGYVVQFRRFAADGTPSGEVIEVASDVEYGGGLDIAGDAAGNFTVVWSDYIFDPAERNIYARRYDGDGTPRSAVVMLRTTTVDNPLFPAIAMDDSGRSIITWKEDADVYAHVFDAQGNSVVEPFVINSEPADGSYYASVAMNGAGEAVVAWGDASFDVRARRLSLGAFPVLDLNGAGEGIDFATDKDPGELLLPIVDADELTITAASPTLVGATIEWDPELVGAELGIDLTGTNIAVTYSANGITLSGVDTVANYQQVLRTVVFAPPASFQGGQTTEIRFTIDDGTATSPVAKARVSNTAPAAVLGRHLYYAGAKYDAAVPGPTYQNHAYHMAKTAYLPGSGTATFANVSSYTRGINGIVLFTTGDYGTPTVNDFTFKMGTSSSPGNWINAPAPTAVTFRENAGPGGADIIEITWPSGVIKNTWLEVTMLATANTGLAANDVFYFGSRVGDSGFGNNSMSVTTGAADSLGARNHLAVGVGVENPYDYDRNGVVGAGDELAARNNGGLLFLLNLPASGPSAAAEPLAAEATGQADLGAVSIALRLESPTLSGEPSTFSASPTAPARPAVHIVPEALAAVLLEADDVERLSSDAESDDAEFDFVADLPSLL